MSTADVREQQEALMKSRMEADGIAIEEKIQFDYFGFGETHRHILPDGVSFIEFKVMNEGDKRRYQNGQNRDVTVVKNTGDARLSTKPGDDRHSLLTTVIVGWNLMRGGTALGFTNAHLKEFLDGADPLIVEGLEKAIRKAHPWLLAEMSVEDIDREIESLQEMREVVVEREAGNAP